MQAGGGGRRLLAVRRRRDSCGRAPEAQRGGCGRDLARAPERARGSGPLALLSGAVLLAIGIVSVVLPIPLLGARGLTVVWAGAIFVGWIQTLRGIVELVREALRRPPR